MRSVKLDMVYVVDEDFLDRVQARSWMANPEERLLFAILERAVRDYLGNQDQERLAAQEWFFDGGEGEVMEPFSFAWICEQLGVDPGHFRSRLGNTRNARKDLACRDFDAAWREGAQLGQAA